MNLRVTVLAGLLIVTSAGAAMAQAGSQSNPISDSIRQAWDDAKGNLRQSADVMAEGDYGFRPVETVRTFGQILAHVAGANFVFCAAAKGDKSPFGEDHFEKSATTKAEIVKAVNDSIAFCDGAYKALTDQSAAQSVTLPFGTSSGPRARALMNNTGHVQEHYGNLVTYFRVKGMVPPSSRR